MSAYSDWVATVQADFVTLGYPAYGSTDWTVTTMPENVNSGHAGEPAIRLSRQAYSDAYFSNMIPDVGYPTVDGNYVYVLATAMTNSNDVITSSPHVMTASERAANAAFTGLDTIGNATGISTLISSFADISKQVVVGVIVAVGVAYFLKRK